MRRPEPAGEGANTGVVPNRVGVRLRRKRGGLLLGLIPSRPKVSPSLRSAKQVRTLAGRKGGEVRPAGQRSDLRRLIAAGWPDKVPRPA